MAHAGCEPLWPSGELLRCRFHYPFQLPPPPPPHPRPLTTWFVYAVLMTLPLTIKETLKWLSSLSIVMQNHSDDNNIGFGTVRSPSLPYPPPQPPHPLIPPPTPEPPCDISSRQHLPLLRQLSVERVERTTHTGPISSAASLTSQAVFSTRADWLLPLQLPAYSCRTQFWFVSCSGVFSCADSFVVRSVLSSADFFVVTGVFSSADSLPHKCFLLC